MSETNNIVNILILLAVSDHELHEKERDFINDLIVEKGFEANIDDELEKMRNKFRDDFDTSCIYYLNSINNDTLRETVMDLAKRLAAADLIVKDREIKFLELVRKTWEQY